MIANQNNAYRTIRRHSGGRRHADGVGAETATARRAIRRVIHGQQGFSLLELLVVVAILVAVSFIATSVLTGVDQDAQEQVTRVQMVEIAKAIRQFKADTGYYPKQGAFDLEPSFGGGTVPIASLPAHAGADNAARTRWFYSPVNLEQLWRNPLAGEPLGTWNPDTGRGWRGPYLTGFDDEVELDIHDGINDGTAAGNPAGDPFAGTLIPDVDGLRDAFRQPFLVFGLDLSPRIVSMGPNGEYQQVSGDDIELWLEKQ